MSNQQGHTDPPVPGPQPSGFSPSEYFCSRGDAHQKTTKLGMVILYYEGTYTSAWTSRQ